MTPFEQGFFEELQKIALDFDPALTSQMMAAGEGLPPLPAQPQGDLVPLLKAMGGILAKSYVTETPGAHRYMGHNPPEIL
jgi:hypothetical protein